MPLAIGFDYGLARIGVATGQTLTQTASPLKALPAKDGTPQWEAIEKLLAEWKPDVVVIGLPLHEDGTMSDMAERAKKFGQRIHGRFGVQVAFIDEYHSTREAREHLNYKGRAGDQDGKLDATAASVILERWLESNMHEIRSQKATEAALQNLINQVRDGYGDGTPLVVGIHTGGAWVATRLCEALGWDEPATLDISLYRDDFETNGLKRSGTTDRMPQQLNGENILLIDDVLFTGRTIRAALNVLFDYGRPGAINLGILFDRGGRELPIEPTFLGESLGEKGVGRCKLAGPEPLVLMTPDSE